jgi:uncharacterized protein (TIGR02117 family)
VALLLAGCAEPAAPSSLDDSIVYVIGRGWHTDVALPVEEIAGPLTALERPFPGVRFLTFGFGERQFLVNRATDFGAMLRALLPSQSALLVTALGASPQQAFGAENVVALRISRAGLDRIEAAIWREFEDGDVVRLADGPYPGSAFYAAGDTYDGFFTCNTWTAGTLRAGGVAMPGGVLFSGQVMRAARRISAGRGPER